MEFDAKTFSKLYPQLREERAEVARLNDERDELSKKQYDEVSEHQKAGETMGKRHERELKVSHNKINKAVRKSKITEEVMRLMLDEGKNWLEAKCFAEESMDARAKAKKQKNNQVSLTNMGSHTWSVGGFGRAIEMPKPGPKNHRERMAAYHSRAATKRCSK